MTFARRMIETSFTLDSKTFTDSGTNSLKLSGLRTSVRCIKAGGQTLGSLEMQIFGMKLSQMNDLATLGLVVSMLPKNTVTVSAGDEGSNLSTVFTGTIFAAWGDFQAAPQVPFNVLAQAGGYEAVQTIPASSYRGSADVGTIMSSLATLMGLNFQNNGVSIQLADPYFSGSALSQVRACAKKANINAVVDNGALIVWPKGKARDGEIPLISPETGLVAYPSFTAQGIGLKTLYNPAIGFGGQIQVQSSLTPASGTWAVTRLDYELDSLVPNGSWFCNIEAFNPKYPQPVVNQ